MLSLTYLTLVHAQESMPMSVGSHVSLVRKSSANPSYSSDSSELSLSLTSHSNASELLLSLAGEDR